MGKTLVDIFYSDAVGDLVTSELVTDEAAARARVDEDDVARLVIIPAGFSARVFPMGALAQQIAGVDVTKVTSIRCLTPEQQIKMGWPFSKARILRMPIPLLWKSTPAPIGASVRRSSKALSARGWKSLTFRSPGRTPSSRGWRKRRRSRGVV
jgi:hypothetical protein